MRANNTATSKSQKLGYTRSMPNYITLVIFLLFHKSPSGRVILASFFLSEVSELLELSSDGRELAVKCGDAIRHQQERQQRSAGQQRV